jgi:RTX calcium-binding nonapeptide repeat (4 copies)
MTRPSNAEFLLASAWTYTQGATPAPNPFPGTGRQLTSLDVGAGFFGAAFLSSKGQVIVAFEGTDLGGFEQQPVFVAAQLAADAMIYRGEKPPAFDRALAFTQAVIAQAARFGVGTDDIFVTGHSLGGAEAAYVAAQLGLGGETFGAPGIAKDLVPPGASSQLTNYVEWGDPVGNYSFPTLAESNILYGDAIARFGSAYYVGPVEGLVLLNAGNALLAPGASDAQEAAGLGLLAEAAYRYHLLTHYTAAINPGLITLVSQWTDEPTRAELAQLLSEVADDPAAFDPGLHAGSERIAGDQGRDLLMGFAGRDHLTGGRGADRLFGGTGADAFVFTAIADSTPAAKGRDTIYDFSRKQRDRIDLSAIDADTHVAGDQAFAFIGKAAFHGAAGELRYDRISGGVLLRGDVDGDGRADFAVVVKGLSALGKGDFLL